MQTTYIFNESVLKYSKKKGGKVIKMFEAKQKWGVESAWCMLSGVPNIAYDRSRVDTV